MLSCVSRCSGVSPKRTVGCEWGLRELKGSITGMHACGGSAVGPWSEYKGMPFSSARRPDGMGVKRDMRAQFKGAQSTIDKVQDEGGRRKTAHNNRSDGSLRRTWCRYCAAMLCNGEGKVFARARTVQGFVVTTEL